MELNLYRGMQITQMDLITAKITQDSSQVGALKDFIELMISEAKDDPKRKFMAVAQSYYENRNDIMKKRRMVIGKDMENHAVLKESRVLANNKLNHNFMKKLTRQKLGYMLGKPFSLTATKADDEVAKEFFQVMQDYLSLTFYMFIKNVGRDSIVKGIGWVMMYYDEQGKLRYRRCPPEEIIPIWADDDHIELEAVIRHYEMEIYHGNNKVKRKYVEYWTTAGVYYFKYSDDGHLIADASKGKDGYVGHFAVDRGKKDEEGNPVIEMMNWNRIPFIPFKYDPDEQSLLSRIKDLVDDYDRKTSGIADDIDDHPNSVTVVKNYDGASKEEFVQNKNEYRTIFVQGDGDARALETPLNVADVDKHIQRLREDIYEFGQGVNTADKDIRDTSGVALRFLYADLDMDCVDWGCEVQWSLHTMFWFFCQDILMRTGKDYTSVDYSIVFNTDVIINETETITNAFTSKGLISEKTIAANHPWVIDPDKELQDMREEQEDTLDLEAEYAKRTSTTGGSK